MAIQALLIPAVIEAGIKVIERLFPDPNEAAKAKLQLFELQQKGELANLTAEVEIATAQSKVNEIEASSDSFLKSNWRPVIGWICAAALLYQFLLRPFIILVLLLANITVDYAVLDLDIATLMTLLFGMLGLGFYRTTEKIKGVN